MTTPVWFLTLPGVMTLDITGPAETGKCLHTALYWPGCQRDNLH